MRLAHRKYGDLDVWLHAGTKRWMVVASDAQGIVGLLERGEVHPSWKLYGSPDQADGLFLAARPEVSDAKLFHLEDGARRLLPSTAEGWRLMDLDEVREFVPDLPDFEDAPAGFV